MDKKAVSQGFVVILIIGLIFLIIVVLFIDKVGDVSKDMSAKAICKSSVYASFNNLEKPLRNAQSVFGSDERMSDVNCPTQEIKIDADLRTESGQLSAKNKIAVLMYDCLDQFGQIGDNKLELFETKKGIDMYCVICDVIKFEDKNKEIKDIFPYLAETKLPNSEKTYLEILTGYQTKQDITGFTEEIKDFVQKQNAEEVNTQNDYAITFVYYKEGYFGKFKSTTLGETLGLTVGTALLFTGVGSWAGAIIIVATTGTGGYIGYQAGSPVTADWKSGVLLMPYTSQKLKGLECSYLPAKQNK
jgi:hypothetical protein